MFSSNKNILFGLPVTAAIGIAVSSCLVFQEDVSVGAMQMQIPFNMDQPTSISVGPEKEEVVLHGPLGNHKELLGPFVAPIGDPKEWADRVKEITIRENWVLVQSILDTAKPILKDEPNIREIAQEKHQLVHVVGDLHGAFTEGVARYFQQQGFPGQKNKINDNKENVYVFNGDFVDRGTEDIEVMVTLLLWKILKPKHVFLIRGNHETEDTSITYGFQARVDARFPDRDAHSEFVNKAFKNMPVGAVLDSKVFIVHGGIAQENPKDCEGITCTIDDLNKEVRSMPDFWDGPLRTLLWADPGLQNEEASGRGGVFDADVTKRFLEKNKLKLIVRAHQHFSSIHSMQSHHDDRVYTIHSAPDYQTNPSNTSYCTFSKDEFESKELQLPEKLLSNLNEKFLGNEKALTGTTFTDALLESLSLTSRKGANDLDCVPKTDYVGPENMMELYGQPENAAYSGPFSYREYHKVCEGLGLGPGEYFADTLPSAQKQLSDEKGQPELFVRVTLNRPLWSRYNPDPTYWFNYSYHESLGLDASPYAKKLN
jgi:diadenosine tetraphosphatase ApaH/serine/threonine PP2A family protein phosphatase